MERETKKLKIETKSKLKYQKVDNICGKIGKHMRHVTKHNLNNNI